MKELPKTTLKLVDFPPKLRQVLTLMIESDDILTISEASKQLGLNLTSVSTMITRARKKGYEFHDYLYNKRFEVLKRNGMPIYKSLVMGAISGSHQHQKLYAQLSGDLVERQQVQHEHKIYIATPTGNVIPADVLRQHKRDEEALKKKQEKIIDVEVIK